VNGYSDGCLFCDKFWATAATLEELREKVAAHEDERHLGKTQLREWRKTMTATAKVIEPVEADVDNGDPVEFDVGKPGPGQLALPGLDGIANDWIELAVAGRIALDRNNPNDCALMRRLVAGKSVDLDITGYVVGRGQTLKRDEEEGDEVTFTTKVKVTGLRPPF
jgi:hypothetical protein